MWPSSRNPISRPRSRFWVTVLQAARSFGVEKPRAALLAATEKVSPKMRATTDAAEITRLHLAGEVAPGAIVEGPLALDVAISPEACRIKGLDSTVGGEADILVFPNIESGNVFYKSSTLLSGARLAAAVVGTQAPCVLTSRAGQRGVEVPQHCHGLSVGARRISCCQDYNCPDCCSRMIFIPDSPGAMLPGLFCYNPPQQEENHGHDH